VRHRVTCSRVGAANLLYTQLW